jgi:hypothetical protein
LISTSAPASFSLVAISSASALATPSFTGFGAPSNKSLSYLRQIPVNYLNIFKKFNF